MTLLDESRPLPAAEDRPIDYPPESHGLNFYTLDRNLRRLLRRRAPALAAAHGARLEAFGAWVGGPLDAQAAYTDRHAPPRLESHDRSGAAVGRVIVNPAYAEAHAEAYRRGTIGLAFGPDRAPHLLSFVMGYLLSEADISVHCPVTMTGAVAHVLDRLAPAPVRDAYLPDLVRMDGRALSGGTWATERHGGSDVGATTTAAAPDGGAWRLTGLKWFTSNAGAGLALATARPEGAAPGGAGLACYLVPDRLPDGSPNAYHVRRLKDKLGTRGLPTGEIELDGAWAVEVAPPPHGLRVMMEALEYSRVHNAVGAAALQRRALIEAACWAVHRNAFGGPIARYPMVRDELIDLAMEQEASAALAFESAMAFDQALADEDARPWLRTVTALAKHRTAAAAVRSATRAVELVGGNGYTEEWPTARLYRDSLVTAVWEGPANIQALELLRAATGRIAGDAAFLARIDGILGTLDGGLADVAAPLRAGRDRCAEALAYLRRTPEEGPRHARRLMELMSDLLCAALLLEEATADLEEGDRRKALVAARYVDSRFGPAPAIGKGADPCHEAFDSILGYAVVPS